MIGNWLSAGSRKFLLSSIVGHNQLLVQWVPLFVREVERPGRDAD